jgi:hypothetical protein
VGHDVDLPLVLPDIERRRQRVTACRDASIVEKKIDRAKFCFGLGDEVIRRRLTRHIAGNSDAADVIGNLLAAFSIDICDDNACAASGEFSC